ncbi:hypothetical protein DA89_2100 [Vibrio paracholerae]|nr:hypothetical protein DA89_2100 [Vibrio paracholerae]
MLFHPIQFHIVVFKLHQQVILSPFIDHLDRFLPFAEFRLGKMSHHADVVGLLIDFESVDEFELPWSQYIVVVFNKVTAQRFFIIGFDLVVVGRHKHRVIL